MPRRYFVTATAVRTNGLWNKNTSVTAVKASVYQQRSYWSCLALATFMLILFRCIDLAVLP